MKVRAVLIKVAKRHDRTGATLDLIEEENTLSGNEPALQRYLQFGENLPRT